MEVLSDSTQAETLSSSSSLESSTVISACRTELWAPLLEGLAIDSVAIDIGDDFIGYINEDGLDGAAFPVIRRDSESDWEYDDDEVTSTVTERFPQLSARVQTAIDDFGGTVFPKLSWSAPTDAEWIRGPDGMKCHSLDDIAVLLKASDFAQFDLQGLALPEASRLSFPRPKLILKPYIEPWHQTLEFRCFVNKRKLRGVCPRHLTGHLPFLKEMMFGEENGMGKLKTFVEHKVMARLVAEEYDKVVIDVYKKGQRYVLVDLGPWDEELTDPLLFTWEDLAERSDDAEWREVPRGTIPSNPSALRK
ncbi:hypothetical protein FOL47_004340 [Perkinsus chesapeaki]|uniref:Cell division cycle protein 123 n=1 Tax=Perkinsus chesapeaki TaxID=330153 RepID=A0A7J6M466_PERCH|nr:hypothetical protein FOL47_004340 [Perkinsus chesapeaki]